MTTLTIPTSQPGPFIGDLFTAKQIAPILGDYYAFTTTAATLVVTSLQTLTEASPALIIENTALAGGPNITLDFVRLQTTAADAASTTLVYAWKTDTIRGKWASAGSALTPQNVNAGTPSASVGTVHAGALVVATAQQSSPNAKTVSQEFLLPTGTAPVQVLGDLYDFRFGGNEASLPTVISNIASNGAHTFATGRVISLGPVTLSPGSTLTLFLFSANAANQPSYTFTGGWYEF